MNYSKQIYWLTRLDGIHNLFVIMMTLGILSLLYGTIKFYLFMEDDKKVKTPKTFTLIISAIIIGTLGLIFVPTSKEVIFIVGGGKVLDYAAKDTSLNKIPGQLTNITTSWLDKKLNEIEGDIKKETKK